MKKGKYAKGGAGAKALILVLTVALLVGVSVGSTLAWLTAKSEVVTNTFTESDINITLEETKEDFKMIPGWTIDKDPKVTVAANSEDNWLFVKVDENCGIEGYTFDGFIEYAIADGWTVGNGTDIPANVWHRKVSKSSEAQEFKVLSCKEDTTDTNCTGCVKVKDTVTKEMMDKVEAATDENKPTLTFQAAAIQLYESNGKEFSVKDAYAKVIWPTK